MVREMIGDAFICDHMLVKLARWLRMAGFDTIVPEEQDDAALWNIASSSGRVLLTRDKELSSRKGIKAVRIISDDIREQFKELGDLLRSFGQDDRVTRCPLCNSALVAMELEQARRFSSIPPKVMEAQNVFYSCPGCRKVYWEGSHWARIASFFNGEGLVPHLPRIDRNLNQ